MAKRRDINDPFYNPDLSDSDMSSGLSPSPPPKARDQMGNSRTTGTMAHSTNRTSNNGEFIDIVPKYDPPRRGFVLPDGDFDFLMHFCYKNPEPKSEDKPKKKRKRGEEEGKGKAKEERPEPVLNCTSSKETPAMSWIKRAEAMGLRRPGGGIAAHGNGGEGSSRGTTIDQGGSVGVGVSSGTGGTMDDESTGGAGTLGGGSSDGLGNMGSVGGSTAGGSGEKKPYRIAKRVDRRARTQPKRTYTWRDPVTKNKSGQRDGSGKGKDSKGKGKEL